MTSLERLLSSPDARARIGIDVVGGEVIALYPRDAVAKSLTRVVEELKLGKVTVPDLYTAKHRKEYAESLPRSVVPAKKTALKTPVSLDGLTAGKTTPAKQPPRARRRASRQKPRTHVIPANTPMNVTTPRINVVQNELLTLDTDQFPTASAVLLRVFIELSVDHFVSEHQLAVKPDEPLAKRLKAVAARLELDGAIAKQLKTAIDQVADGPSPLAPGISTFNQYVHNKFTHPKPSELYAAWDEVQPLMEQVWP